MPHCAFVGKVRPWVQEASHVGFFYYHEGRSSFLYIGLRKANVNHAQSANILLHIGKHHAQLFLLNCEREVCSHDGLQVVLRVIYGHHTRRHINAHHLARRTIYIAHQRGKATSQGFV